MTEGTEEDALEVLRSWGYTPFFGGRARQWVLLNPQGLTCIQCVSWNVFVALCKTYVEETHG